MNRRRVDSFGLTDRGKVRERNEDHFVVVAMRKVVLVEHTSLVDPTLEQRLSGPEAHLFAVADGVGGRPGGELASSTAVEGLLDYVGNASQCFNQFDVTEEHAFLEQLENRIQATHEMIIGQHGDTGRSPATTLTLVILVGPRAYVIQVGDSRAYYLHRGRLKQITRDQTIGEYMVGIGAWTDTQAARSPTAGALASAIGGSEVSPVVGLVDLDPGDTLLLCTDGLSRHVGDDAIESVLAKSPTAEAASRELVRQALEAGGEDNVTVIVSRLLAD